MANVSNRRMDNRNRQYRQTAVYRRNSYVDGNTVRKLNAVPERRREETTRRAPKRRSQKKPARNPVSIAGIDRASFMFMFFALSIVILVSLSYVYMQNDVRDMKKEIISLQNDIEEQQERNDIKYNEIVAGVDLSEIYRRATKKLNMVMADGNKVYKYDNKKSDMVKQHADIPQ